MLTTRQETDSFGTIAVRNDRYWEHKRNVPFIILI
ncbi:hypothetical protein BA1379B_010150 [Bartonella sp. A1379B]|nr:hypothetical protein BA1379B_010150 [Bartonella sp. A1379B]